MLKAIRAPLLRNALLFALIGWLFAAAPALAQDRHAGQIADIAVIVAAGVEREHVALLPALW